MSALKFRRPNNTIVVEGDWPDIRKYCTRRCACPGMWWRSRIIETFGGASPCKLELIEDGETNFYRRIDCVLSGKWKLPESMGGATVKTCSGTSFTETSGNLPFCESSSGGDLDCPRPDGYDGISLNYSIESECTGSSPVTSTVSAAAARAAATTTTGAWGPWQTGFPTGALAAGGCNDTRGPGSCSFFEKTIEIQLGGNFVPFIMRRRENVTQRFEDLSTPVFSQEIIEVPVTERAPFSVVWIAAANQLRTISAQQTLTLV